MIWQKPDLLGLSFIMISRKPLKLKLEEFSLDLKLRNIDSLILDSRNQELINVDL